MVGDIEASAVELNHVSYLMLCLAAVLSLKVAV